MTNPLFLLPIKATLAEAWEKTHGAKGTIICAFVSILVLMFCFGFLQGLVQVFFPHPFIKVFLGELGQFIGFFLQIGIIYIGIQRARQLPITFRMVFHGFRQPPFFKVIGLYALQALIIFCIIFATIFMAIFFNEMHYFLLSYLFYTIGVFLLLFTSIRLGLSMGLVVDQNAGPIHALVQSFKATRGNFWRIFCLFLINAVILLVGFIPLGIGLIWALPFSCILYGVAYKALLANLRDNLPQ